MYKKQRQSQHNSQRAAALPGAAARSITTVTHCFILHQIAAPRPRSRLHMQTCLLAKQAGKGVRKSSAPPHVTDIRSTCTCMLHNPLQGWSS